MFFYESVYHIKHLSVKYIRQTGIQTNLPVFREDEENDGCEEVQKIPVIKEVRNFQDFSQNILVCAHELWMLAILCFL